MKIAQVAPLWESVPPKAYGGTELVVYLLCQEFIKKGHEVTLFACGESKTDARLVPMTKLPMREAGVAFPVYYELQTIAKVMEQCEKFDIVHNHMGYQILPFAKMFDTPILTTLHGAFCNKEEINFYRHYKNQPYVSISNSQRYGATDLNYISTVYNGIEVEKYTFQEQPNTDKPYLAFLGRISIEKGAHLAIQLAKEAGFNLILAGKIGDADREYYEKEVKHLIDNKQIIFIGELGHDAKVELLKGAYATVHPVTWPEPFGLVMAESMACGTPVLALNKGSIPEVIKDKKTGFVENDIKSLIKRVKEIEGIDRKACRTHVEKNFSSKKMAEGYLSVYRELINNIPVGVLTDVQVPAQLNLKENT